MLAFTFPGQGSQRPSMGSSWVDHPSFELAYAADEILSRDIHSLLLDADENDLKKTENAQIATFIFSLIVLDAVERLGLEPTIAAGHSLGEYTALAATAAISFEDGIRLVGERGSAMADAAEEQQGSMIAVLGLTDEDAQIACNLAEGKAWLANMNSPGQVVISGDLASLDKVKEVCKNMGAKKIIPLAVSGAFHSPFMEPARERLRKVLSTISFRDPSPAIVANVDAKIHSKADDWPQLLSAQLCSPVRWHQSVTELYNNGARSFIEIGPGNVLTGLTKRTLTAVDESLFYSNIATPQDLEQLMEKLSGQEKAGSSLDAETPIVYAMTERLVVAPSIGRFRPADNLVEVLPKLTGNPNHHIDIKAGDLIGWSGKVEIRTPFSGILQGILVLEGERVAPGQPVAWLRVNEI